VTDTAANAQVSDGAALRRELGLRGWLELAVIGLFYGTYSLVRNRFGSGGSSGATGVETARANAQRIIDLEDRLGLLIEDDIQEAFLSNTAFIQFWNLFYGLFHFLVTGVVLVFLYFWRPRAYAFWRTAGLTTTALALFGFALFPLMPPRLLNNCGPFGACESNWSFVDTVVEVGGIWSFDSGGMAAISNQFAAMPSLHFGWALWCSLILVRHLRNPAARLAALAYPWATLFAILVTANHWWVDAVGGGAAVLCGLVLAEVAHNAANRLRSRRIV